MKKIGIGIDYSNICKDYNTSYLDRDNTDPATKKCMKKVMVWTNDFLSDLLKDFDYNLHNLTSTSLVSVENLASKRFLFYSLEKEITIQNYIAQKEYKEYKGLISWEQEENDAILIKNDEDGGAIYFYFNEDSRVKEWISTKLADFSLDEVPFDIN
ncbi:hypothetical protein JHD48_05125 [Sulfurimonas sp. SAG-AH-194-I05]|nr:hypothetical protein [Sulfurimonas sp. SAG-AH-194-I05]MDF1875108.1 hypothetical protein [Sulfurimonas sp. SAG-AH-194-I05]